jgi:V/A-type H+-transporting ATPase subunit C
MKYGYSNARTKALRTTILPKAQMEAMAGAKSLQDVFGMLERTSYKEDLVAVPIASRGTLHIELALGRNFSGVLRKLVRISPKDKRDTISGLFEKYEINNIKTMLVGKHIGESGKKITALMVETGMLRKTQLDRMSEMKSVKEVVGYLSGTAYGVVLEKKMREYERTAEIQVLLQALDEYYYKKLPLIAEAFGEGQTEIVLLLKSAADANNMANIMRGKKEGFGKEELLGLVVPESGSLKKETLKRAVTAKSPEECAETLAPYLPSGALERFLKDGSVANLEIALEKSIAVKALKMMRKSTLSLAAIAGFLLLKEEEIKNIRKIIKAKEFDLGVDETREMLVFA